MTFLSRLKGVYVLELEGGKYYVGSSTEDLEVRLKCHLYPDNLDFYELDTAKWVDIHDFRSIDNALPITSTDEDIRIVENYITLLYMRKYGWENVRGGAWCQVDMNSPPKMLTAVEEGRL